MDNIIESLFEEKYIDIIKIKFIDDESIMLPISILKKIPFFEKMFSNDVKENKEKEVFLNNFTKESFKKCLKIFHEDFQIFKTFEVSIFNHKEIYFEELQNLIMETNDLNMKLDFLGLIDCKGKIINMMESIFKKLEYNKKDVLMKIPLGNDDYLETTLNFKNIKKKLDKLSEKEEMKQPKNISRLEKKLIDAGIEVNCQDLLYMLIDRGESTKNPIITHGCEQILKKINSNKDNLFE